MPTVVGLAFEPEGTIHYFSPAHITLAKGDVVLADTAAGPRVAQVVIPPRQIGQDRLPVAVRSVTRIASPEDVARNDSNTRLEQKARLIVPDKIALLDLSMKMIDVDADWDGTRITIFFAAEGRVDFRELVRLLSGALGVRVQMHQLGARDHAKMVGGLASCGRETCCSTWMPSFEPVSMRMAKEQSLFLNPSKFSGNCGKLKCCLRYEYELYCEGEDAAVAPAEDWDVSESA
jgi:cell fate regulator YaaT (PSP1 superfamily)